MSEHMNSLLEDGATISAIGSAWPHIKEILVEQQLISSSKDEEHGDKVLRGHTTAYRALEKFHLKCKQIDEKTSKRKS